MGPLSTYVSPTATPLSTRMMMRLNEMPTTMTIFFQPSISTVIVEGSDSGTYHVGNTVDGVTACELSSEGNQNKAGIQKSRFNDDADDVPES